jgi:hypothetical protein
MNLQPKCQLPKIVVSPGNGAFCDSVKLCSPTKFGTDLASDRSSVGEPCEFLSEAPRSELANACWAAHSAILLLLPRLAARLLLSLGSRLGKQRTWREEGQC